jgi:hypothetical protein
VTCTADQHGTRVAYNYGCRCPEARKACAKYEAQRQLDLLRGHGPRLVDATGTRRRLQALAVMGWTQHDIGLRLGVTDEMVRHFMAHRQVRRRTAERVAALFAEIGMTPGPSQVSRQRALAKGWASPLMWDDIDDPAERPVRDPRTEVVYHLDEVAIEETMAGRRVKLSHEERQEVFRRLIDRGLNASQIAQRLGMTRAAAQKMATRVRSRQVAA